MRKYQIYSGAKPSSVNKTFAVNWGSKYFTVSPIAGKEGIRGLVCDSSAANGNQLTCTFTNPNKDSVKATPVHWTCVNPDYDSGKTQTIALPSSSPMTLGPNSAFSYQWDASEAVHAGKNTCQALFAVGAAFPYQQGSPTTFSETIDVYNKFSAPTVDYSVVGFNNAVYGPSNNWPYSRLVCRVDSCDFSVKISNHNESEAACYQSSAKIINKIAANSSAVYKTSSIAASFPYYTETPASHDVSYSGLFLDSASLPSDSRTKSAVIDSSHSFPAPPQLISCLPTNASSNSFQITIKNNNNTFYYCRAMYHRLDGSNFDYWMIECPANGTGTMIDTSGNAQTFSLARGVKYDLSFYFYTLNGSAMSYQGTQRSRTIHYPFQAPDSGYSYVSPIVVREIYDDDTNPTKVTFSIENHNPVALAAQLDLYVGTGTSGTRVDYWRVSVPAMGQATCPNRWSISGGSTYTLVAYFMAKDAGYHGTAVSGSTQYNFTVAANT